MSLAKSQFFDLTLVLVITFALIGTCSLIQYCYEQDWHTVIETKPDIDDSLVTTLYDAIDLGTRWSLFLSLLTCPLAALCAATNNRLTMPIRLLATAENLNKFFYSLIRSLLWLCNWKFECPIWLIGSLNPIFYWIDTFDIIDIAQYCQLFISLRSPLPCSHLYFKYTLKWPLIQLIIPYLLRCAVKELRDLLLLISVDDAVSTVFLAAPLLFMCSLDFVTNLKLKQLKRSRKVKLAERLLMIQMLLNSFFVLILTIFYYFLSTLFHLFLGGSANFILDESKDFNRIFIFNLVASSICILLLKKPCESRKGNMNVSMVTAATRVQTKR